MLLFYICDLPLLKNSKDRFSLDRLKLDFYIVIIEHICLCAVSELHFQLKDEPRNGVLRRSSTLAGSYWQRWASLSGGLVSSGV